MSALTDWWSRIRSKETLTRAEAEDRLRKLAETSPEMAWMLWFRDLTDEQKDFVQACAEKGIEVTEDNYEDAMAAVLRATQHTTEEE